MQEKIRTWTGTFACIAMLVMILDSALVVGGALEGVMLCVKTVIPSLFPFFLISGIVNSHLSGKTPRALRWIGQLCKIPTGCESLLLLGMLGGYPVGAQNIRQAYEMRTLSKSDAQRMLGFCNNAGPSFIFGLLSSCFTSSLIPWVLWLVHILSALIVAVLLPSHGDRMIQDANAPNHIKPNIMMQALRAMANVCGWIILFRVILTIINCRLLQNSSPILQTVLAGFLELANGCCGINMLVNEGTQFVLCAGFLGFGGCCVLMQTKSVVKGLSVKTYILGKVLQCGISLVITSVLMPLLYPQSMHWGFLLTGTGIIFFGCFLLFRKNSSNLRLFGVQYQHLNI